MCTLRGIFFGQFSNSTRVLVPRIFVVPPVSFRVIIRSSSRVRQISSERRRSGKRDPSALRLRSGKHGLYPKKKFLIRHFFIDVFLDYNRYNENARFLSLYETDVSPSLCRPVL